MPQIAIDGYDVIDVPDQVARTSSPPRPRATRRSLSPSLATSSDENEELLEILSNPAEPREENSVVIPDLPADSHVGYRIAAGLVGFVFVGAVGIAMHSHAPPTMLTRTDPSPAVTAPVANYATTAPSMPVSYQSPSVSFPQPAVQRSVSSVLAEAPVSRSLEDAPTRRRGEVEGPVVSPRNRFRSDLERLFETPTQRSTERSYSQPPPPAADWLTPGYVKPVPAEPWGGVTITSRSSGEALAQIGLAAGLTALDTFAARHSVPHHHGIPSPQFFAAPPIGGFSYGHPEPRGLFLYPGRKY